MYTLDAISILFLSFTLINFISAELSVVPPSDYTLYDTGVLGKVPTTRLKSARGLASRLHRRVWSSQCDRPEQYHFIAPHGILLGHAGPEIIDNDGNQVWFGKGFRTTYNFRAQWYKGEQYLTWWSGNDQVRGHGSGYYFMLDKHYRLHRNISAHGITMMGDLHEFLITPSNTALLTVYDTIPWNLTAWGIADESGLGYIRDGIFQEIDLETNELLFQWRASEHITLEECFTKPSGEGKTFDNAWDWFHINSVQKDDQGNYLVSSRYAHALFYIDGTTGNIIWYLGGKNNSFRDLSDGRATSIARQHHANWVDGFTAITVFDNGDKSLNPNGTASRGLKIAVDRVAMTVKVLAEAYHPLSYFSASQGSVQQLEDGNLLVGWGYAPAFTEFSPDGSTVVCDTQFGALHSDTESGKFTPGAAESYRAFQGSWKGFPLEAPDVAFNSDGNMYVSWNGATELRVWVLEGSDEWEEEEDCQEWEIVERFARTGFESNVTVDREEYEVFRLTALDAEEGVLGSWLLWSNGTTQPTTILSEPSQSTINSASLFLVVSGFLIAAAAFMLYHFSKSSCQSRHESEESQDSYLPAMVESSDRGISIWTQAYTRLRCGLDGIKEWVLRQRSDEEEADMSERQGLVVGLEEKSSEKQ